MAKGKHSTALFEVINKPVRATIPPPPVVSRAPLLVTELPPPPPQPAPTPAPVAPPDVAASPRLQVDSDHHQISLRISYTTAAVTLFAVLVVVVLAYLVGHGIGHAPQLANATTEELQNGPAHPSVMNVSDAAASTPAQITVKPPVPTPGAQAPAAETPARGGTIANPTNVKRIIGINYVIMQSYPDEATAKEAQNVLLANGIPCTIERGPQGWSPMSWYSVVGTQPFDHITKNPQYDAYIKSIERVKYGEKSKFKKFDPNAYRWK